MKDPPACPGRENRGGRSCSPPLLGDLIIVIPIPESCHYRNVAIVRIIQSKNQADIAAICILRAIPYSVVIRKEGFDGSYRLD